MPLLVLLGFSVPCELEAQKISPMAKAPDWTELDVYQDQVSRDEFVNGLSKVYTNGTEWKLSIRVHEDRAEILKQFGKSERYTLRFRPDDAQGKPELERYWRDPSQLPPLKGRPILSDLHIAIDPGHIGGEWAKIEERWFTMGDGVEIMEGELTLKVAKMLKTELEKRGAKVTLVRDDLEPASDKRPADFASEARRILRAQGISRPRLTYKKGDSRIVYTVQWQSEKIFYRTHEIRARAAKLNDKIQPDLCLCLHFNAAAWGNPSDPELTAENHLHILVNGTYSSGELGYDDQRFQCLKRLLQNIHGEELAISGVVASAMAERTKLPPYTYRKRVARRVNDSPYVWARNLLANRIFTCPVLYFEPYVMNNSIVYRRLAVGDYLGRSRIEGRMRSSIFQDYTMGIIDGLEAYYSKHRK